MLKALIFDVDGTLADTEMAHLAAFNHAFAQMGMGWHWDVPLYTQLLSVSGGKERIKAYWQGTIGLPKDISGFGLEDTINRLHEIKTAAYEQAVHDGVVKMRPGVLALMSMAKAADLRLAIATTTSPTNIAALLQEAIGPDWQLNFSVIEDASTAPRKKPDPMVYQQTLSRLGLAPQQCIAFEDSQNGLQSALAAGLPTIVTPNRFTQHHCFDGALRVLPSMQGLSPALLQEWHKEFERPKT